MRWDDPIGCRQRRLQGLHRVLPGRKLHIRYPGGEVRREGLRRSFPLLPLRRLRRWFRSGFPQLLLRREDEVEGSEVRPLRILRYREVQVGGLRRRIPRPGLLELRRLPPQLLHLEAVPGRGWDQ